MNEKKKKKLKENKTFLFAESQEGCQTPYEV